jgi:hypothetical protein
MSNSNTTNSGSSSTQTYLDSIQNGQTQTLTDISNLQSMEADYLNQ